MNEIISYFAGKVADKIPSFILSRLLPPKKVAEQVKVNLRGNNAICLELNSENPQIDIWFEIINLSNLKLNLNRLLIEVWFSQRVFEGSILKRYDVPPRGIVSDIRYWQSLTIAQKSRIESSQSQGGQIYISLTAYFESKVGIVEVNNTIERSSVKG
ncbi:MAG: hypothetical protein WCD76_02880 [Pyrinomonadaceae bacterium]